VTIDLPLGWQVSSLPPRRTGCQSCRVRLKVENNKAKHTPLPLLNMDLLMWRRSFIRRCGILSVVRTEMNSSVCAGARRRVIECGVSDPFTCGVLAAWPERKFSAETRQHDARLVNAPCRLTEKSSVLYLSANVTVHPRQVKTPSGDSIFGRRSEYGTVARILQTSLQDTGWRGWCIPAQCKIE